MAVRKVTVNLPEETIAELREVAQKRNITLTEAIRQAIATEKFVDEEREKGGKILIERRGGKLQEVVFK